MGACKDLDSMYPDDASDFEVHHEGAGETVVKPVVKAGSLKPSQLSAPDVKPKVPQPLRHAAGAKREAAKGAVGTEDLCVPIHPHWHGIAKFFNPPELTPSEDEGIDLD